MSSKNGLRTPDKRTLVYGFYLRSLLTGEQVASVKQIAEWVGCNIGYAHRILKPWEDDRRTHGRRRGL